VIASSGGGNFTVALHDSESGEYSSDSKRGKDMQPKTASNNNSKITTNQEAKCGIDLRSGCIGDTLPLINGGKYMQKRKCFYRVTSSIRDQ
jgi:hypothetical protein